MLTRHLEEHSTGTVDAITKLFPLNYQLVKADLFTVTAKIKLAEFEVAYSIPWCPILKYCLATNRLSYQIQLVSVKYAVHSLNSIILLMQFRKDFDPLCYFLSVTDEERQVIEVATNLPS